MRSNDIERYVVGELSVAARERFEAQMRTDSDLRRRVQDRQDAHRAFAADVHRRPFSQLETEGRRRLQLVRVKALSALGALTVTVGLFVMSLQTVETDRGLPSILVRGGPAVRAALFREGRSRFIESGAQVYPRERLSFVVEDPVGGHLTVILQEESGRTEMLYSPTELGRLAPGSRTLPGSVELDDVPGNERIFFLLSSETPRVDDWIFELRQAHETRGLSHDWLPPSGVRMSVFAYRKVSP